MKKPEPGEIQKTALSGSRLSSRNARIAKDRGAVTNARLLGSTGFRSAPISLSTTPVPPRNRALVTSGFYCADAPRSVGTLAPALRYFRCPHSFGQAPLPSPTSQPNAFFNEFEILNAIAMHNHAALQIPALTAAGM